MPLFELRVNQANLKIARESLKRAIAKLPCTCSIEVTTKTK